MSAAISNRLRHVRTSCDNLEVLQFAALESWSLCPLGMGMAWASQLRMGRRRSAALPQDVCTFSAVLLAASSPSLPA